MCCQELCLCWTLFIFSIFCRQQGKAGFAEYWFRAGSKQAVSPHLLNEFFFLSTGNKTFQGRPTSCVFANTYESLLLRIKQSKLQVKFAAAIKSVESYWRSTSICPNTQWQRTKINYFLKSKIFLKPYLLFSHCQLSSVLQPEKVLWLSNSEENTFLLCHIEGKCVFNLLDCVRSFLGGPLPRFKLSTLTLFCLNGCSKDNTSYYVSRVSSCPNI